MEVGAEGVEYKAESEVSLMCTLIITARFHMEPMNNIKVTANMYMHHAVLAVKLTFRLSSAWTDISKASWTKVHISAKPCIGRFLVSQMVVLAAISRPACLEWY